MVMDKGLSIREVEDFLSVCSSYIDVVKLGWGTSYVTPNLKEKIKVYKKAGIPVYFGGGKFLFGFYYLVNQLDDFVMGCLFGFVGEVDFRNRKFLAILN